MVTGTEEGSRRAARPAEARVLIDITGLPRPQRHRTVAATLEAMEPGVSLIVINDHDPTLLRRALERRHGARLAWERLGRSDDRVAVAVRLGEEGDGDAA